MLEGPDFSEDGIYGVLKVLDKHVSSMIALTKVRRT